jgi:hypothetical protein
MITTENVTFAIILIVFFGCLLLGEAVMKVIKKFKKKS